MSGNCTFAVYPDRRKFMPQVIATGITTLDEARYFAAMGVAWLGFDAGHLTIGDMESLAGWVVGPQLFAEFSSVQEDQIFALTHKTRIYGICAPASSSIPAWYKGTVITKLTPDFLEDCTGRDQILLVQIGSAVIDTSMTDALQGVNDHTLWLEAHANFESLITMIPQIGIQGVVIRCNKEGDAKDMSFEQYDFIFNLIEKYF